jgi:hypothetical protein
MSAAALPELTECLARQPLPAMVDQLPTSMSDTSLTHPSRYSVEVLSPTPKGRTCPPITLLKQDHKEVKALFSRIPEARPYPSP